jgi:spermidine synthase
LIAGFALLPILGMETSLRVLAASYGVVALLSLLSGSELWRERWLSLGSAAALFAASLAVFPTGLVSNHYLPLAVQRVARSGTWQIAAIREGLSETSVYLRNVLYGRTHYYELMTNGYAMSGTAWGSRRYMKLYVYWPVALAGPPSSALLISYGVGSTAKALTDTKSLERIDIVDISREILELNSIVYPDPAEHPLGDPRVTVHIEDGRHFLQTTKQRFDLITGEPPPPKAAGIVNLYTREYFQLIFDRLESGGVNTYWLPVHSMTDDDAKAIIRGYCEVFDDCSLWGGWGLNWMLVGSREASWPRSEEILAAQWQDEIVGPELRQLGFEFPEQLGALFMADAGTLAALVEAHEPLVDDFPKRLSNELPDTQGTLEVFAGWMDTDVARERFEQSEWIRSLWPSSRRGQVASFFDAQKLHNTRSMLSQEYTAAERIVELDRLLTQTSLRTPVIWSMGASPDVIRMAETAIGQGDSVDPLLSSTLWAARAFSDRDLSSAASHLAAGLNLQPRTPMMLYYRLYALCADARVPEAERVALAARNWLPQGDDDFWEWMSDRFGLSNPREQRE